MKKSLSALLFSVLFCADAAAQTNYTDELLCPYQSSFTTKAPSV